MHLSWDDATEIHYEYISIDTNTITIIEKHSLVQQHVSVNAVLLLISDSVQTYTHRTQQLIPL